MATTTSASNNANTGYYDGANLNTPEIATCLDKIDRYKSGTYKFKIDVLTPYMNQAIPTTTTVVQNSSNIISENSAAAGVSNLTVSNYIEIKLSREVCTLYGGAFTITGDVSGTINSSWSGSASSAEIKGSINIDTGTASGKFTASGGSINLTSAHMKITSGKVNLVPSDRYIKKGSKWIVVFIGGDITKPQILAPYTGE